MAASALGELGKREQAFRIARGFAIPLIFLSLPNEINLGGAPVTDQPFSFFWFSLGLVNSALLLAFIYYLCTGIISAAARSSLPELAQSAHIRRSVFLAVTGATLILSPLALNMPEAWQYLLIALGIIGFLSGISIILLLRRAGQLLGPLEPDPDLRESILSGEDKNT
ncbi:hypothetical protein [Paenibacillus chitinolyticus]|uniref:hypothetical protein n=1 Tax=Paenibacillus chitinolyticus TaxID=79263 RepID=UPI00210F1C6C|nr:hypothetical protein [Paenibacillus chitinolyticus]